ncbi:MAG: hypothetical protein K9N23_01190 [Akkermansiaceae bacterium]|nr:hypothetical protein [Akkermansiaceae bacterium]MCF7730264.1 hypothetical protein [Akkermansiaceae bacterium]
MIPSATITGHAHRTCNDGCRHGGQLIDRRQGLTKDEFVEDGTLGPVPGRK